jgi:mannan polymerase II complex ANP1 subunit
MAKRLKFTVVGLPHYTIWHLYEPSVDDLKHMEEIETEKKQNEAKAKAEKEKVEKINLQFDNPKKDWEHDKAQFEDMAKKAAEIAKSRKEAEKQKALTEAHEMAEQSKRAKEAANEKKEKSPAQDI